MKPRKNNVMKRTLPIITALLLAPLAALHAADAPASSPAPAASATNRPNILVILADDLGWADTGFNGSKQVATPHLDSLATNGIRFSAGYVTAPQCSPTRAGLLTGRYQQRFGHDNNNYNLACFHTGQLIFPEPLTAVGYVTGMVGKWHLGPAPSDHPQQHGFDEFFGFQGGGHAYLTERPQDAGNPVMRGTNAFPLEGTTFLTTTFGRESASFIRRHTDKPWFLYVAFNSPHIPQAMPPGYEDKVKDIKHPVRARCVAMTMNMDDAIGEILDALRVTGQEERTLIVFASDNGGTALPDTMIKNGSLNVPYRGVKGDVYEGGIREPFVIQWKSHLPAGTTLDAPVSSLDLLPTALAVAGASPLPGNSLEGVNLLPYLTGKTKDAPHEALYWRWQNKCAVRQGDWKWIRLGKDPEELYDLAIDPYEKSNCAASHPEELKKLAGLFAAWNAANPELNPAHYAKDAEATAAGEAASTHPTNANVKPIDHQLH